jgi:hypothetical protein
LLILSKRKHNGNCFFLAARSGHKQTKPSRDIDINQGVICQPV